MTADLECFAVVAPGLEPVLLDEARTANFRDCEVLPGGVVFRGDWAEVWRANLTLRGATRILVRLASFRALHLAQLDKRTRKLPWQDWLRPDVPVRVEAVCKRSRIYHNRAAAQRIERNLANAGMTLSAEAAVALKVRIDDDLCTISVDTSGESLHRRGLKTQVNKAPMRETLASLFLRAAEFDASAPLYDPMCGSGTFVIEAAEISLGLLPGRARHFAFEHLATFDPDCWKAMQATSPATAGGSVFAGSDRDQGAVQMSRSNADRAGVGDVTEFHCCPISEAAPNDARTGLVIVNPPYGGRIGKKAPLHGLYAAFGERMRAAFVGWRVALITSEPGLAKVTGLAWQSTGPVVDHGGTKVRLYQTGRISQ